MSRLLVATLVSSTLLACGGGGDGGGGSTPTTPPVATPLQIMVDISREISEPDQSTVISWFVSVENNGVGVNSATVAINGKNVPHVVGFTEGTYRLSYETNPVNTSGEATYLVGQDYAVTVQVGGSTYTDTLRVPGGITIDAAGTSVGWAQSGNHATILVTRLFGSTTYTSAALGSPASLTSPQAIPATAYPSADTYQLNVAVQNQKLPPGAYPGNGYFASLVGPKTHFVIQDFRLKRVVK